MTPEHSKPCGRSGCTTLIRHRWAYWVAYRRYCSNRCAALERIASGVPMPKPTLAQSQRAGHKGGTTTGTNKRKAAMLKAAAKLEQFIDKGMRDALTRPQQIKLTVLLSRAYLHGHENGKQCERQRQRDAEATLRRRAVA